MTGYSFGDRTQDTYARENFEVRNLDDEIRVDGLCRQLLQEFHHELLHAGALPPETAGALAHGADYFLREFVIPDRRENIFSLSPWRVRQFAGNWYIVRNLEPNMAELTGILHGVAAFYDFCRRAGMVTDELAAEVRAECAELDYYRRRIDSFWAIEDDGYRAWEEECSLKK